MRGDRPMELGGCLDRTNIYSEERTSHLVRAKYIAISKRHTRANVHVIPKRIIGIKGGIISGRSRVVILTMGGPHKVIYARRHERESDVIHFLGCPIHIACVKQLSGSSRKLLLVAGGNSVVGGVVHTTGGRRGRCGMAMSGRVARSFLGGVTTKIPVLSAMAHPYAIGGVNGCAFSVVLARKLGHRVHEVYRTLKCRIGSLLHIHIVGVALSKLGSKRCEGLASRRLGRLCSRLGSSSTLPNKGCRRR